MGNCGGSFFGKTPLSQKHCPAWGGRKFPPALSRRRNIPPYLTSLPFPEKRQEKKNIKVRAEEPLHTWTIWEKRGSWRYFSLLFLLGSKNLGGGGEEIMEKSSQQREEEGGDIKGRHEKTSMGFDIDRKKIIQGC